MKPDGVLYAYNISAADILPTYNMFALRLGFKNVFRLELQLRVAEVD